MSALTIGPGVAVPFRHLTKHMLITGATGTGKTTTAAAICERLSAAGVPVLAFDAKGDLESLGARVWCPFGSRGPRRAVDLSAVGPDLIARALDLSPAQSGAVEIVAAMAEAENLALCCLDDLSAGIRLASAKRIQISLAYGLFSDLSAAAVSRAILPLRRAIGGAFGRPGLDPFEAAQLGGVSVYSCGRLAHHPGAYAAAVAGCLLALYQEAAEVGAVDRPSLAVLIDEAHLLFDGATPAVVRKLEQVARLIRSRGIMLIFATQSPADLPETISAQCLSRIQHGLRATTAGQMRGIRAAADSMPAAPGSDLVAQILGLGIGEALCSVPDIAGSPAPARRVRVQSGRVALHPVAFSPA